MLPKEKRHVHQSYHHRYFDQGTDHCHESHSTVDTKYRHCHGNRYTKLLLAAVEQSDLFKSDLERLQQMDNRPDTQVC